VIVNVWPAIASVPVRGLVEVFAAIVYPTAPLPDPVVPVRMVIHPVLLVEVQLHPGPLVTETLPVLAPVPTDVPVGEMA